MKQEGSSYITLDRPVELCYHERNQREGGKNMTIQEANELVLSKLPEEKKEAFIKAISMCRNKAEKAAVLEKFGIQLTAEELEAVNSSKLTDAELDEAAGGCCGGCGEGDCGACVDSLLS